MWWRVCSCAKSRGLKTVAFTGGDGGAVGAAADIHVNVPHDRRRPRVQEVHRTLIHAVCDLIERCSYETADA